MVALVLLGVVGFATVSSHMANIHLALTIIVGGLHIYVGYYLNNGKLKNEVPASYAYISAFVGNAILSFAFSWWFSGIVWVYVLCIYIAANQPTKVEDKKSQEGDAV
jgi:hypothetical protein